MKKAKKLLSLFLAALMLMSCFGAISASAMTMDAAEAAAAEFNANIPDHSAVYANKSAKQWNTTMKSLDIALSTALSAANVKATIYSDSTTSMLMTKLSGLLYSALEGVAAQGGFAGMLINGILKNLTPAKVGEAMEKDGVYLDSAAYLKSVASYDEIDSAKLVWGITPGDREAFVNAAGYALYPVGYAINFLSILKGIYPDVLVPIIEALGQGAMPDEASFKAMSSGTRRSRKISRKVMMKIRMGIRMNFPLRLLSCRRRTATGRLKRILSPATAARSSRESMLSSPDW